MKKYFVIAVITACCFVFASFIKKSLPENEVPYPEGYRSWTHIKSMIQHSVGYHHIYANDKAMQGYKTGKFPNGSVIVSDFLEGIDKNETITEGKRKYIDVMVKDTILYKSTGGWGYEEFDGDSRNKRVVTQAKAVTACFNCHAPREANNYVFSSYRN